MTAETTGAPTPDEGGGQARHTGFHWVLGLVAVVVGAVVVYGTATLLGLLAHIPPALSATRQATGEASLTLSVWPDSKSGPHGTTGGAHPDWVTYGPSTSLWVPAHSLVTVTILNYDTATKLNNSYFAGVHGTVGDTASADGVPFTSVAPEHVAHTFTIHMFPTGGQPGLDVTVPLPGVVDNAPNLANGYPKPVTVTFQIRTGDSGRYIWQCFDPCGGDQYIAGFGGPMSTVGYMAGTITVGGNHA